LNPLKKDKKIIHIEMEFFLELSLDHTTNEEFLGEMHAEPVDMKLQRYKSNWL
jgi:hypothetical protein